MHLSPAVDQLESALFEIPQEISDKTGLALGELMSLLDDIMSGTDMTESTIASHVETLNKELQPFESSSIKIRTTINSFLERNRDNIVLSQVPLLPIDCNTNHLGLRR